MAHLLIRFVAASLLSALIFVTATAGPKNNLLLVAHRGASGYAPEHTLAAYTLAIEQGADFVEQDLQLTKDGHFVCLH
ncbi:MAG TPA: glycerophosphodiester phosphodiesterase family protein, partial [Blastocatellia bacterium]|nr:glycerophosphodiester phosphodiesterase family protein [Blastocatellia bacterium]